MRKNIRLSEGWRFHLGDTADAYYMGFDDRGWRQVTVPHDWAVEHPFDPCWASGTGYLPGGIGWYRGHFTLDTEDAARRVRITFEGVYKRARVWINSNYLGQHAYGYTSFSFDVSEFVRPGENVIAVRVDHSEVADSRWYTGSGVDRPVTLTVTDPVCFREHGIFAVTEADDGEEAVIGIRYETEGADKVRFALRTSEGIAAEGEAEGENGCLRLRVNTPRRWSPEDPYLYSFTVSSGEDRVESYFALRTLSTETLHGIPRLCLNGKPYFFHGLLDQGYWSDGLYTPAVPQAFEKDILAMKSMGFNTLRKHIKLEPERFYYDCDRLGMIVFQDMVNNGEYRYFRDTVLPTIHIKKRSDRRLNPDAETRRIFLDAMEKTVRLLKNHPCICLWTVFNEGWGQFCADDAYRKLKAVDDSRFVDSTSGWFHQSRSDVDSLHIYFGKLRLGKQRLPQLLSEFGGFVWKLSDHSFNTEKTYGYRIYKTQRDFIKGLQQLYGSLIPLAEQGLCGAIYTQVSDVEDETNGLFTFDRAVLKVSPEELKAFAGQLQAAVR